VNIFAMLTFDYTGGPYGKGEAISKVINEFERVINCGLSFQGVHFKESVWATALTGRCMPPKMLVEVALFNIDPLDGPRHEGEAEDLIQRELDKCEDMDCSIVITHGTDYVDEEAAYKPAMTKESQLRTGE